jgi:peptide-methionine (S)-S-oxide reductase
MTEKIILAGGCFWCTEAIFKRLKGVSGVNPGYTGGNVPKPTYEEVCTGKTGHAEAIEILFDPEQISVETLLTIFWHTHDPTTLNQQGADVGTQYRSAIFYTTEKQKLMAEKLKKELDESGEFGSKIVTEILPAQEFYPAENYHLDYYDKNRTAPYCRLVIDPKVQKLMREYRNLLL